MLTDTSRAFPTLPSNLVRIPHVKQVTNYSCGAAAALSLLRYWGGADFDRMRETDLHGPLETTRRNGTEPEPIAAYFGRVGLDATYRHEDVTLQELERAVDARESPIVDFQAWRDTPRPWPAGPGTRGTTRSSSGTTPSTSSSWTRAC